MDKEQILRLLESHREHLDKLRLNRIIMDLKPIKTEADYRQALAEVERLFDAELNTPEGDKLEILTTLIEAYEEKHYPIELPLPYEAILYHLESRHQPVSSFIEGLKRRGVSEDLIHEALNEMGTV